VQPKQESIRQAGIEPGSVDHALINRWAGGSLTVGLAKAGLRQSGSALTEISDHFFSVTSIADIGTCGHAVGLVLSVHCSSAKAVQTLIRRINTMKSSMHRIATLAVNHASAARRARKLRLAAWFSALALAFGAQQMRAATVTYIVSSPAATPCTSGTQFPTIQSALDASPAPDTVEVCPGQYPEQVTITKPVTLEGIDEGNGALAQIILPASPTANATIAGGQSVTAQVYVNNVSGGSVNLTNLDVNGMGFGSYGEGYIVGVLYNDSSGTINHVITSSQNANSGSAGVTVIGFGMYILGGSSKPSVTVENSSVHDFTQAGIFAVGTTTAADLTVSIKNNVISSASQSTYNLVVEEGSDPTVSGNVVSGGLFGILIVSSEGSITGNTVLGSYVGIDLSADGPSVTSNNIYGTIQDGIDVQVPSLKASVVENNTIKTVNQPGSTVTTGTGIELNCNNISSSKVNSNTIMDASLGYGDAPAGFAGSNTYLGLYTEVGTSTCTSDSVSSKARSAARLKLLLGQSRGQ
jgi:parallel beta-helix repeat protein